MPDYLGDTTYTSNPSQNDSEDSAGYVLRYTLFPQSLGRIALPKLSLSVDKEILLVKDFTKKVYVSSA